MLTPLVHHVYHPHINVRFAESSACLSQHIELRLRGASCMLTLSLAFPRNGIRLRHGSRVCASTPLHTLTCANERPRARVWDRARFHSRRSRVPVE